MTATAKAVSGFTDYKVADIALASWGRKEIAIAETEMPITRPVQQLTTAAEAVAQGQFDQAVQVHSHDEIGRLSDTFNDMTTRQQAARQMQFDFVADVSHELRPPLTSIKGMIETLREGAVNDLEVRDRFLETVEAETDRLIRLINDLLVLTRADSVALNLRRRPTDMGRLVQAAADRLEEQARARDLSIESAIEPGTPPAWVDADRIEQVLLNLLDNAIKYSRPGGSITLRVSATTDGLVLVEVRDDGPGIPASELPRVGQRFYRADKRLEPAARLPLFLLTGGVAPGLHGAGGLAAGGFAQTYIR